MNKHRIIFTAILIFVLIISINLAGLAQTPAPHLPIKVHDL